jgi:hypothetical protein
VHMIVRRAPSVRRAPRAAASNRLQNGLAYGAVKYLEGSHLGAIDGIDVAGSRRSEPESGAGTLTLAAPIGEPCSRFLPPEAG